MLQYTVLSRADRHRREFQLAFNIGRLQEIFEGIGGMGPWWNEFSRLWASLDITGIGDLAQSYANELGITLNPEDFN
jgi:hypothetical protein